MTLKPPIASADVAAGTGRVYYNAQSDGGASADGTNDDRAQVQSTVDQAVNAIRATGEGAIVYLPQGIYYFNSSYPTPPSTHPGSKLGITIPPNLPGRLTIRGAGVDATTIKLSNNARCAFWINQTADYQTFQNVTFEDFSIDNNNAIGRCHLLIGTVPEYITPQRRLNVADINVRRVKAYNTPADPTEATTYKSLVHFFGAQWTDHEVTQTTTQRVTVEDWETDSQQGVLIASNVGNQFNHFYDDIYVRRGRHVQVSVPATTLSQTSVFIGGSATGGHFEISGLYSKNVADDCVEVGSMQSGLIEDVHAVNPFLVGMLFRLTQALTNPQAQQITVRDYTCELLPGFTSAGSTGTNGMPVNWIVDNAAFNFGNFDFERCQHIVDGQIRSKLNRSVNDYGFKFQGPIRRLTTKDCRVHYRNFDVDNAGTQDIYFFIADLSPTTALSTATSSAATAVLRDSEVLLEGTTASGGGGNNFYGVQPQNVKGHITVDGFQYNAFNNPAGVAAATIARLGNAGTAEQYILRRLTGSRAATATTGRGVRVDETTNFDSALIDACDFKQWTNAGPGRDVQFVTPSGTNAQRVRLGNNVFFDETTATPYNAIASAATITLPSWGEVFTVSGTTNITSVTASWASRRVTLIFSGILTFTDGSNLKLAGNFTTTADDTITLVSDGTNWYEAARSVN